MLAIVLQKTAGERKKKSEKKLKNLAMAHFLHKLLIIKTD